MRIRVFLPLAFLAIFFGCQTSTTTSPEVTGDFKGTVGLIDSHGNFVTDKSGVLVQAEGTSFSGMSDTGGNWIIHNLPTRTYSLSFSKAGYGTMKNTSFSFVGGGTVLYDPTGNNPIYLSQPVTFTVTLDSVLAPGINASNGAIIGHLNGADLADSSKIEVDVYIGTSVDTFQVAVFRFGNSYPPLIKNGFDLGFRRNFSSNGFMQSIKSRETLYFKATAFIFNYYGSYFDVKTGKYIDANPPPMSNVLSAIVP